MTDSSYAVRFLFIAGITTAFKQAIDMLRRGGACVLNGLPPGEFPISISENNPLYPVSCAEEVTGKLCAYLRIS